MFEQTLKNSDDILHKGVGGTNVLDHAVQSCWLPFLT